ncbi:MAG: hypothetical protein AVDCRST_MAG24-294 [uncultured Nocardioidaceae bacterium]|uniref:Polyketide cyclase/dehydrase n=1 Tax=uncultured Nocardioidaceae bacterium TaxID=253824 RepID=A0A6J4KZK0_9ACTN|nr:MAG: hypothetical protein AVDCRST_MAG24-294 [uncultured Nocardioidaceae bacterium]
MFVAAPRPVVFAYFADPRNRPEWQASLRSIELLDPLAPEEEPYVGLRWVDKVKVGPPFELQISRLEPGELWSEVGSAGPFTAYGTLLFEDETRDDVTGTRVHCIARVHGRGAARPLGPAATALGVALVRVDLGRAARVLASASG